MNKFKNKIYSLYKEVSILGVQYGVELANKLLKNVIEVNRLEKNSYLNKLFLSTDVENGEYAKQLSEKSARARDQILSTDIKNRKSSFARKLPKVKVTL